MKAKLLLTALGLSIAAMSAQAVVVFTPFDSSGNGFFNSSPAPAQGLFTESFTFTVPGFSDITTGSVTATVNGARDIDFTDIRITGGTTPLVFTQDGVDPNEHWKLDAGLLLGGVTYTMTFTGTQVSSELLGYSGQLSVQTVPEPNTYALLLAGAMAVTFVARRRKLER